MERNENAIFQLGAIFKFVKHKKSCHAKPNNN